MAFRNGFYGFSGLADTEFLLEFIAKDDLIFTQPNQNAPTDGSPGDKLDSDVVVDGSTLVGRTEPRMAQAGVNYSDWDAGMTYPASIGNYVWFDFNEDGLKDASESGVKGVEISLLDENDNVVANTTSDEGGFYQFTKITPGRYRLSFDPPPSFQFTKRTEIAPSGLDSNLDSDVDVETGKTDFFEVLPGQNDTVWGAGLISSPGAITLSSMTVTRRITEGEGEELVVTWITSAELDTFGYHIRRGTNGILDNTVQVTNATIPSQGSMGGIYEAAFPYNAETDLPAGLLDFWLVELEVTDKQNIHGPVGVSVHPTHQMPYPEPDPTTEPDPTPEPEPELEPTDTSLTPEATRKSAVFLPAMVR